MFANLIEMAYSLVKFVQDYNSLHNSIQELHKKKNPKESLIKKTTFSLIKFSRYLIKYMRNYQKLIKEVKANLV